ncbi:hypothetical protein SODALDRAFT_5206 [Sodiomyces alkalinus F11]|uniref:Uncharacterized protein n=1 Tax=Sodiomyces alkalinus (strain CBS 110278 / VKM F-3762 / F11) TaxID=1314773 RepID=A0A3N2Q5S5_SODAK|nr:hypothetical protein SODALDRAFT_5206 [Sodiomyces alkalinus F11]ROT42008.1 hypothetical protein SODALDRAFT_5206 [Sodiomyces alkalinus F11]
MIISAEGFTIPAEVRIHPSPSTARDEENGLRRRTGQRNGSKKPRRRRNVRSRVSCLNRIRAEWSNGPLSFFFFSFFLFSEIRCRPGTTSAERSVQQTHKNES